MKVLILKDTAISGNHVAKGSVVDADEGTLKILKMYGKAVALAEANADQQKLVKKEAK